MSNRAKVVFNVGSLPAFPGFLLNKTLTITLKIDGVLRNIYGVPSNPNAAAWEYLHVESGNTSATNLEAMLNTNLNGADYIVTRSGNDITIDTKNWDVTGKWNFTPTGTSYITISSNIAEIIDPMTGSVTVSTPGCADVDNGSVVVDVNFGAFTYPYNQGNLSAYTFLWNDGPAVANRSNMADGTYSLTVTDAVGNTLIISNIVVVSDPLIVVTGIVTNATGGGSNGAIDVSVSGGVVAGDYTYLWDDGPTTQDRTLIASGSYGITVTDDNGCTMYKLFNVADDASTIVITETLTHILCNGQNTGAIALAITLGTGPYTFLWNDGATVEDRTNLLAGVYTVWVTDSLGSIQTKVFTLTEPTVVTVSAAVNGDVITLTVGGGVTPYTYLWNTTETTKDITVPIGGDYTVDVTDDNGCVKQIVVKVAPFKFYFAENPIELALELAAAYGTNPNESFVCEVYVEKLYGSNTFEKVIELEQPADTDGKTIFDVQDVIYSYLMDSLPAWNENTIKLADGHFIRFYLKHAEKWGDPPAVKGLVQEDTFFASLGGLSDLEHSADTFQATFMAAQKPFFTWEPLEQDVYEEMQPYLHFMVNVFNLGGIELHGVITYTDGTTTSLELLNAIAVTKRFEVYRVPVGYTALGLAAINPAKGVAKYEVWMEDDAGNVISEIRTYNLVKRPYYSRIFIYLNSLGGWSTLVAEGHAKGIMKVAETALQRKLESGYAVTDTETEVVKKSGQQQLLVHAGDPANEDAAHLQDLAISRSVFEVTDERFEPVRISYHPAYMDEQENYVPVEFVVLPPVVKKYTPAL
jgi:SprB-like repeat protein